MTAAPRGELPRAPSATLPIVERADPRRAPSATTRPSNPPESRPSLTPISFGPGTVPEFGRARRSWLPALGGFAAAGVLALVGWFVTQRTGPSAEGVDPAAAGLDL